MIAVDTSVLACAHDRKAGQRHKAALKLLRTLDVQDVIIPLQVLEELYWVMVRRLKLPAGVARNAIQWYAKAFAIVPAVREDLDVAMEVSARTEIRLWDAKILAVAKRAGCQAIYTESEYDTQEPGLPEYVNPFTE